MSQSPASRASASFGGVQARAATAIERGADLDPQPRFLLRRATSALKGIKLDLPDRQVTGMIGPSGCGKSTLLRVLNRMYDLYPGQRATGEVMMDGRTSSTRKSI